MVDFKSALAEIRKDAPTAGDVHVASTAWKPPKKPKVKKAEEGGDDDAGPLYINRPLLNADELSKWATDSGVPNVVKPADMHTTIVYSKAPASMEPETDPITVAGGERRLVKLGAEGKALTLVFDSPTLAAQHDDAVIAGASHDFPHFLPHVTLSYDAKDFDHTKLAAPDLALKFGPEQHKPLDENWADKIGKVAKIGARDYRVGKTADGWVTFEPVEPVQKRFEFKIPMRVEKAEKDGDRNLIFGWASIVEKNGQPYVDVQGDEISPEDLEDAFYDYVKNSRAPGLMHESYGEQIGKMVECMVFTKEKQAILKIDLGFVGAWVGYEVAPEIFAKVKAGDLPQFSIGGEGVRVPKA